MQCVSALKARLNFAVEMIVYLPCSVTVSESCRSGILDDWLSFLEAMLIAIRNYLQILYGCATGTKSDYSSVI